MSNALDDLVTPVLTVRLLPPFLLTSVKGVDVLTICCGSLVSKNAVDKTSVEGVARNSDFKTQ